MTYSEVKSEASKRGFELVFETKISKNGGNEFEVGYVYVNNEKTLFCKRQPTSNSFYLCNEFRNE